jgi:hypothetical protein
MNATSFRRLALSFEAAVEGAHMSHPDFRVNGRIFATIQPGERTGMVKVSPDEQARLVRDHPTMFVPESGAWGRQGCTRVQLAEADPDVIGEAMTLAWQLAMRTPARKPPVRRRG